MIKLILNEHEFALHQFQHNILCKENTFAATIHLLVDTSIVTIPPSEQITYIAIKDTNDKICYEMTNLKGKLMLDNLQQENFIHACIFLN